ncbi:MAG: hypothetical protein MK085_07965 [Phycisphaerales bacterium]|nr:hypothetical protein [Phycisphaerales bacterium]
MTADSEWYEEVAPGVRQIALPNVDFTWLDIDLEQTDHSLDSWVPNPEAARLMREPFQECGRLRVAEATLIRVEIPPELNEKREEIRISILISPERLIIARHGPMESLEEFISEIVNHAVKVTPLIVTCELLDDMLDLVRYPISQTAEKLRELEDLVANPRDLADSEMEISEIRQEVLQIDRQLDPLQTLLKRLLVDASAAYHTKEVAALRELSDRANWFQRRTQHQLDHARILTDQIHMQTMDDMSTSMYRLSIIATIFLPLSFITGLLGINVGGMPGAKDGYAFWIVCGGLLAVALFTFMIVSRAIKRH